MKFHHGKLVGGTFTKGVVPHWDWSRNGGCYNSGRDFFSVHWEVRERDPAGIRLHVEAPTESTDGALNSIKRQVLVALLASDIESIAQQKCYAYKRGTKISLESIRDNKSTEAFRLVVDSGQRKATSEQDIATVHDFLGSHVDQVLTQFRDKVSQQFP